ncbi:LysE/ArgO family amino acid transporter [Salinibacterium sp. SWN1162]|uniref:LysE/ArgO family amino acid transporter n=1 Tax=Salinibacterium sp. SWN1162 TaxID=2792053 RepID=UPI0018CEDB64|nr:LysE/ArgO family amino acid transporter [Salinibacterium sp. SWN1162]MBH0008934.1 amino acid transporter [Salinibacterium sp. SWN1162]
MPPIIAVVIAGLGFGLSLIIAIGAQNAFVLRQGLRREHVTAVVLVCMLSDIVLITAGVAGLGALIEQAGWLLVIARVGGALFLLVYAFLSLRRAVRPQALTASTGGKGMTLAAALSTALALTWLNPHVYIDTVLLLGSIGGTYGDDRWWFALGACLGSVIWFTAIGYGSRYLRPLFAKPVAWRVLDIVIAIVMVVLAGSLIAGLFE